MDKNKKGDNLKTLTKTELLKLISSNTGFTVKNINKILDETKNIICDQIKNKKTEKITLSGICKISIKTLPKKEEREGINPFTKIKTIFKAKPAQKKIKITPLKSFKDSVE